MSSGSHIRNHNFQKNIVVLAGGVGGAKLADGLAQIMPAERLTIIVNTGDDFDHLGLRICPDLDTVVYTLAGVANPETGWGRADESWRVIEEVIRLGGPGWFRLGDLDLATHLVRGQLLAQGATLTEAIQHLCRQFGLTMNIWPMSDDPAPTMIETDGGLLDFQTWFVEQRWQPAVRDVHLPEDVRATPQVLTALEQADVVLLAPSNPFVSLAPILNVYPIRAMIADLPELVVAVSPIVGDRAVKGPAGRLLADFGLPVSGAGVAEYYGDLLDLFIYDQRDQTKPAVPELAVRALDTLMRDRADRARLAEEVLATTMELIAR